MPRARPALVSVVAGAATEMIFGQAFEAGLTEAAGQAAGLVGQVGYGPADVNPEYQSGWVFFPATFNVQSGNNDEFQGSITAPAEPGTYRYAYRFSLDGATWTYCDIDGAGSNDGLTFEVTQLPALTVTSSQ